MTLTPSLTVTAPHAPARVRAVFAESLTAQVFLLDAEDRLRECNSAAARALRRAATELVARPITEFLSAGDRETWPHRTNIGNVPKRLLLSFVSAQNEVYSLVCWLTRRPGGAVLVGEPCYPAPALAS